MRLALVYVIASLWIRKGDDKSQKCFVSIVLLSSSLQSHIINCVMGFAVSPSLQVGGERWFCGYGTWLGLRKSGFISWLCQGLAFSLSGVLVLSVNWDHNTSFLLSFLYPVSFARQELSHCACSCVNGEVKLKACIWPKLCHGSCAQMGNLQHEKQAGSSLKGRHSKMGQIQLHSYMGKCVTLRVAQCL